MPKYTHEELDKWYQHNDMLAIADWHEMTLELKYEIFCAFTTAYPKNTINHRYTLG